VMKNVTIERTNAIEHEADVLVKKLLLLGAGESGKSTVFKQMVDLYGTGFTEKEINDYIPIVYTNTINSLQMLIRQSEIFATEEGKHDCTIDDSLDNYRQLILSLDPEAVITPEIATAVKAVWAHPGAKRTFSHRSLFQIPDSAYYFFDNVDTFSKPDFKPTKMDMLRTRVRTTGILETSFKIEDLKFKMFDVGGQRNERKKWIHCFENVTAVIFVCAISEFDQLLYEDDTTNRMTEALNLFEEICNSRWFSETAIILFLNKKDLFEDKIKRVPLTVCFPEYPGSNDFDECWRFIAQKFIDRRADQSKQVYSHVTCATDDQNVMVVFNAVKDIVIRKGLIRSGLL